jgi:predicted P-loop ATPase
MNEKEMNLFEKFLLKIPKWDGVDYIETYLRQVKLADETQRPVFVESFKRWFAFLQANYFGVDLNTRCFVLVGPQGCGKSSFFKSLIPKELIDEVYDSIDLNINTTKSKYEYAITHMALVEISDIKLSNIKGIISLYNFINIGAIKNYREPYSKSAEIKKRTASFCATGQHVNETIPMSYKKCFPVFQIISFDLPSKVPLENMYAQAIQLFINEFTEQK